MKMKGLDPLSSSDDDDPLYSRSSMAACPHSTGTAGDEELEVEMRTICRKVKENTNHHLVTSNYNDHPM